MCPEQEVQEGKHTDHDTVVAERFEIMPFDILDEEPDREQRHDKRRDKAGDQQGVYDCTFHISS